VANEILLLIGDPRFCRVLVASCPGTIHCLFQAIADAEKYQVPVAQFARNVVSAAIENRNSFLYHEDEGYLTGLLGYWKPISQAVFGNYRMAAGIGTLFDGDLRSRRQWSAAEWAAFNRAVLITVQSYVATESWNHSSILARAFGAIENASSDLYKIDGSESGAWGEDSFQRLSASVRFCEDVMKVLDEQGVPDHLHWRIRNSDPVYFRSLYDELVDLIYELIGHAAAVKQPWDLCWVVQHNTLWSSFFLRLSEDGPASRIVKFKLRRKLYDEIVSASEWQNFQNVKYLGYCLNVMGIEVHQEDFGRSYWPLQKALLAWTKRHYAALEEKAPQVFENCLPSRLSYDKANCRLVKTYQPNAFRAEPKQVFFELDRVPA